MQPAPAAAKPAYDLLLRNGTIYDGAGKPPVPGDIAVGGQPHESAARRLQ